MRGLLLLCFDYSRVANDEFNDWYDTEHIPERERTRGILNARRWLDVNNRRISVASYDLENVESLRNPEYLAIAGKNLSPWSKRVIGMCTLVLRFEGRQLVPGEALVRDDARFLLMAGVDSAVAGDTYRDHAARMALVPGVLSARIFEGTNDSVRYLELYELESVTVSESAEWVRAVAEAPPKKISFLCDRYTRR